MPSQRNPTRQRLISAAIELFASQGVTETTTKQIAELAGVNEVTLFRHFGTKHGLLLAAIEDSAVFNHLGQTLIEQASQSSSIYQALKDYATASLEALEGVPAVVRSVVGEAGQYPAQNREALGRGFTRANRYVAEYLEAAIAREHLHTNLSAEKLASLLNGMLLGYAVIEFTSEFHELWQNREDFLENLVTLFLHGAISPLPESTSDSTSLVKSGLPTPETAAEKVEDLPANLVHSLLQRAQKLGLQEYALAYVLFGAGLSPAEIIGLERSHYINNPKGQLLQVTQSGKMRQVPINLWIMGKRYGSYKRNPLSQWFKSRKDSQPALFVNQAGEPMSEAEIRQRWQQFTVGLLAPEGQAPTIEQAQQTWCVQMLVRGMSLENLRILTDWDLSKLQLYAHRVKEKTALEQAILLDRP
jgi:AcrR family transcriptional regulator